MAQEEEIPDPQAGVLKQWNETIMDAGARAAAASPAAQGDYRIGTEDLLEIAVFEVPELSRTVRVSGSGEVSLPLLGALQVAGMTTREMEGDLTTRLKGTYLRDPQVSVFVKEFKSDPVSVVGAVKLPGLYQIQGQKSLIELLAMAQGFSEGPIRQPGRTIIVTRNPKTQWRVAGNGATGESSGLDGVEGGESIEVPIKELIQSGEAKWNVPINPGDVIKVVPAGTFYVAGDVNRPGGFPLKDFDQVSVIQALAMAGGPLRTSDLRHSVIIRRDEAGNRVEQEIDLRRSRKGEDAEVALGENDILFVPGSVTKAAALRALEATIQVGTGLLIWGR
jgi:polysaccharide export outer membrane protein